MYIHSYAINCSRSPGRCHSVGARGAPAPRRAAGERSGRAGEHSPVRRLPSPAHPHRERVRADAPQRPATPVLTAPGAVSGAARVAFPLSTVLGVATRPAGGRAGPPTGEERSTMKNEITIKRSYRASLDEVWELMT